MNLRYLLKKNLLHKVGFDFEDFNDKGQVTAHSQGYNEMFNPPPTPAPTAPTQTMGDPHDTEKYGPRLSGTKGYLDINGIPFNDLPSGQAGKMIPGTVTSPFSSTNLNTLNNESNKAQADMNQQVANTNFDKSHPGIQSIPEYKDISSPGNLTTSNPSTTPTQVASNLPVTNPPAPTQTMGSPPPSGGGMKSPSVGAPAAGTVSASGKPISKTSELNETQRFAIGFIKSAIDNGLNENQAIHLLHKISNVSPMPGASNMLGNAVNKMKNIAPGLQYTPKPQNTPNNVQGNISSMAQAAPPIAKPVQPIPSLATNPGQQDLQQFEQQQRTKINPNITPLINNQVDQQLTNLPPLQAQELIRYLQSKQMQ